MTQPYSKAWLSYSDQVAQLENRGLLIPNRIKAEQFLAHLNYYRFSGYTRRWDISVLSNSSTRCVPKPVASHQKHLPIRWSDCDNAMAW
jgi:abortive infection bacteriophage resistance protein